MAKKTLTKAEIQEQEKATGTMTLGGHVKELRNRLIVVGIVFVAVTIFVLYNARDVLDQLLLMATSVENGSMYSFNNASPQEMLLQMFRISVVAGIIVALPVACYEIWAFAKPGLKKGESRFFGFALFFGLVLFCVGVAFAYFVTLPFMLNFLVTVGDSATAQVVVQNLMSIADYTSFVLTIFIIFGCVFEMPLLSVVLAKLGIANPEIMKKGRGIAIVLCFLLAAIITPPDILSQIMVAIPMIILYQISIMLAKVFYVPRFEDGGDDEEDSEEDEDEGK